MGARGKDDEWRAIFEAVLPGIVARPYFLMVGSVAKTTDLDPEKIVKDAAAIATAVVAEYRRREREAGG